MRCLAVRACSGWRLLPDRLSRCSCARWLVIGLCRALLHVDAAAEVCPFRNSNARCRDVAVHRPVVANVDLFGGADVTGDLAEDDHGFGEHLRLDARICTDREHVLTQLDLAFNLSFNREIFAAVELAFDDDRFAYVHNISLLSTLRVAGRRRTRRRLRGLRRVAMLRRCWRRTPRCTRLCRIIPFPHWHSPLSKLVAVPRLSGAGSGQYTHALRPLSSPFIAES